MTSGELKHGPIALITTNTPVVATVTQEKLMSKELSNIKERKIQRCRYCIIYQRGTFR